MTVRDTAGRAPSWGASTALWAAVSSVIAAVLAIAGIQYPEALAVGVTGLIAVIVAVRWPFVFAMLSLVVIVASFALQAALGASVGGLADEAVTVLAFLAFTVRRIIVDRALVVPRGTLWLGGFLALGAISSLAAGVPTTIWLQGAFLALKGFILAFSFAQLEWTPSRIRVLMRIGLVAIVVMVATGLVNLVAPGAWAQLLGSTPLTKVGPLTPLNGLFAHPAAFSRMCAVLAIGVLAYRFVVTRRWMSAVAFLALTGMAVLTVQVKTIVGIIVTYALLTVRFGRPVILVAILIAAPILGLLAVPPLLELVFSEFTTYFLTESARLALVTGGATVAGWYFPLGAGFGRFGSAMAAEHYSPEYRMLGWSQQWGLGEGDLGLFLMDNQWPSFIAESGWFGAMCYLLAVVSVFIGLFRKTSDHESSYIRWVRIAGIGWMLLVTIESVASPSYTSPPSYPFLFLAAGIVASVRFDQRRAERRGDLPPPADDEPLTLIPARFRREKSNARPGSVPAAGRIPGRDRSRVTAAGRTASAALVDGDTTSQSPTGQKAVEDP